MNKIFLCGRLTKDPELRTTNSGTNVTTFSIAVDRRVGKDGERQADFFDCVAWRQTADFVKRWFGKGRKILIEGTLQNRDYTAQDGTKRRVTEIIVDQVEFADSRQDAQGIMAQEAPQPAPAPQQSFTPLTQEEEDDLPFD